MRLDDVSLLIAAFLAWARKARVFVTLWPFISYRGHGVSDWPLLPVLCRQKLPIEMLKQYEVEIVERFRSQFGLADWTDMEVMAYARHHGAPTRLLDWSSNPFVALWFAVSEKRHDGKDGAVFQLHLGDDYSVITFVSGPPKISAGGDTGWKTPVLVFASPSRVDRTERQRSVFSLVSFENNLALQPIDQILLSEKPRPLRKFTIPARLKPELRRLLSDIGLDAYQLYGDPDSLGKSLDARLDLSGLKISMDIPPDDTSPTQAPEQPAGAPSDTGNMNGQ